VCDHFLVAPDTGLNKPAMVRDVRFFVP